VVAAAAAVVLPLVVRVAPARLPGLNLDVPARYRDILGNGSFARLALSHALALGALFTFVGSAPQLLQHALRMPPGAFAALQVVGVLGFMVSATQAGRISQRIGTVRAVHVGGIVQIVLCTALLISSAFTTPPFAALLAFWFLFCAALAVRGPAAFSKALRVPPAQMGRASAMMVLLLLVAGALGIQGVAPFIAGASVVPLAAAMLAMTLASLVLVMPYPQQRSA
jgi:MFS transporter, DHA1 family, multidrug resistance protein